MAREVHVRQTKKRTGGKRDIELNDDAMHAFARLVERAAALGATQPDHYLLPRCASRETRNPDRGAGYDPTRPQGGWRSAWRSLRKEAAKRAAEQGIDPTPFANLRFHDWRHTAVTRLAEGSESMATVQAIAGHLSPKMTQHYTHIRDQAKRRAVDALPSYIKKAPAEESKTVQ